MKRRPLNLLTGPSLLGCIAAVVMGVRGHLAHERCGF